MAALRRAYADDEVARRACDPEKPVSAELVQQRMRALREAMESRGRLSHL